MTHHDTFATALHQDHPIALFEPGFNMEEVLPINEHTWCYRGIDCTVSVDSRAFDRPKVERQQTPRRVVGNPWVIKSV
jgi:hypothetical protein